MDAKFSPDELAELDCGVVYTDGSTAGDPKLIEQILENRRATLAAIPGLRGLIVEALENHETVESLKEKVGRKRGAQSNGRGIAPANAAAGRPGGQ